MTRQDILNVSTAAAAGPTISTPQPSAAPVQAGQVIGHYVELLRGNARFCIRLTLAAALLAALLAVYKLNTAPVYLASTKVTVQPTDAELRFTQVYVRSSSYDSANVVTQSHMEYLRSREIAERAYRLLVERYGSDGVAEEPGRLAALVSGTKRAVRSTLRWLNSGTFIPVTGPEAIIAGIQESIEINMIESSFIMEIVVGWDDPAIAADIANILAEVYQTRTREQSAAATGELTSFLNGQRAEVEAAIAALTLRRNEFRASNGIVDFATERTGLLNRLSNELAQLDSDRAALRASRALLAAFDPEEVGLRRNGLDKVAEDALQLERLKEVELTEAISERESIIAKLQAELARLSSFESQIAAIDDAMLREQSRLDDIESRLLTVRMNQTESIETLRLIDAARPPPYPDNPKVLKETAFGGAAGLVLALFILFARDQLDRKLKTAADLAEATGLRVVDPVGLARTRARFRKSLAARKGRSGPLLGWAALDGERPVLVLDTASEERAEAVVQALIEQSPVAATFDIGVLKSAARPGYVPEDIGAILVTLARGELTGDTLAEMLEPLQRARPIPVALCFADGAEPETDSAAMVQAPA